MMNTAIHNHVQRLTALTAVVEDEIAARAGNRESIPLSPDMARTLVEDVPALVEELGRLGGVSRRLEIAAEVALKKRCRVAVMDDNGDARYVVEACAPDAEARRLLGIARDALAHPANAYDERAAALRRIVEYLRADSFNPPREDTTHG